MRLILFALTRAIDMGARVVLEERTAKIEADGVVHMEAFKCGGLWEMGKQKAFLARGSVKGYRVCSRVCSIAKRPVRAESVVKKTAKVVEIDLDESDDENEGVERERGTFVGAETKMKREGDAPALRQTTAAPRARWKGQGGPENGGRSKPADVEKAMNRPVVHYPDFGDISRVRRQPVEWYRPNVEAATEAVGTQEPEHGVEKTSPEECSTMATVKAFG
ncbi:hypothetical protein KFL_014600020 [Klebsormidium nitens]|uniref:Uncharacterized protein n=1 Tax=Klebsormidium nitens TaxID=105231 RepID=A0A1Y1IWR0_KLENI|nr:hypothetical protein KFL_014600020 [Klebsormidium nitens]|eukprot:GAQ93346.1 hypothetical protein KFL_014600020 [Klebsormidium nitens]